MRCYLLAVPLLLISAHSLWAQTQLPDAPALTMEGDIAAQLVDGVDRFLLREIDQSVAKRGQYWTRDLTSAAAYQASVQKNRDRLGQIIGLRDARVPVEGIEFVSSTAQSDKVAETAGYRIHRVRWPALEGLHGDGLMIQPVAAPVAHIVVLPTQIKRLRCYVDCSRGVAKSSQIARRLAEAGCQVFIPTLIDRTYAPRNNRSKLTNREYLYRSAYELGRHLIGYEVHKTLAIVDWIDRSYGGPAAKIAVVGYGEGGMLALYASAVDTRIDAALISGCFAPREQMWQEPIDRNVFGLLEQFGASELATLVAPRHLLIQSAAWPAVHLPSEGGAPATLATPSEESVKKEFERAQQLLSINGAISEIGQALKLFPAQADVLFSNESVVALAKGLQFPNADAGVPDGDAPMPIFSVDTVKRQAKQLEEIDTLNQRLLEQCADERRKFFNINLPQYDLPDGSNRVDTSSIENYSQSVERFRTYFRDEVVGRFDLALLPANPRFRKTHDAATWTGYEVTLDVFPDVFAYGILCVPKNLRLGSGGQWLFANMDLRGVRKIS